MLKHKIHLILTQVISLSEMSHQRFRCLVTSKIDEGSGDFLDPDTWQSAIQTTDTVTSQDITSHSQRMRSKQPYANKIRDAPLNIWRGGGGLEFLLLANFFFTSERKQSFFLAIDVRQFSLNNFFVVCFPYYVGYNLVFFLVNIFFINLDNKLFFLPTFSKTFFSDFCCDKLFFSIFFCPPPPRYQMVRPLDVLKIYMN